MKKLLIATANQNKLKSMQAVLVSAGYDCTVTDDSGQVWQAILENRPDAIVLDGSGSSRQLDPWYLAQELVTVNHTPLVVLARGGRSTDRLRAFQLGVQHCLSLPITPAELSAFLDTVLTARSIAQVAVRPRYAYRDSRVRIDLENREVRRGGRGYSLSATESALLKRFIQHAGKIIGYRELCRMVWGASAWPCKRNVLKTYVSQLRRKVEPDAGTPRYIISRRGLGYAFMPGPHTAPGDNAHAGRSRKDESFE